MLIMKNMLFYNMFKYYNNKKIKALNYKNIKFNLIKNYYLVIKNYRNLTLFSPQENIYMYYTKLSSVNLLLNKKIDKWFIYKLISNLD